MQLRQAMPFLVGTTLILFVGLYLYKNYCPRKSIPLPPAALQEATTTLSKTFDKPVSIQSLTQMSEHDRRNLVVRITLVANDPEVPATVIFKQSLERDESKKDTQEVLGRFAHEWAGAEFANTLPNASSLTFRFYGGNKTHRFILLEDLGDKHISLVDYLKGNDARAATTMLGKFMQRLGQLHAESYGKIDAYLKLLHDINPAEPTWQEELKEMSDTTLPALETTLKKLAIPYTQDLQQEVLTVLTDIIAPGRFTTFVHGDCAPGNDFINQKTQELKMIDFESSKVRSALLDAVFPRVVPSN